MHRYAFSNLPRRRHARTRERDVGPGSRHHVRGRRRGGGRFGGGRGSPPVGAKGGDVVAVLVGVEVEAV